MNTETIRGELAARALVTGVVLTFLGVVVALVLDIVDAVFFLLPGISLFVADLVDRAAARPGERDDPRTLSDAGGGTSLIMFGAGAMFFYVLLDFRSPFTHPFANLTSAGDLGAYGRVPAIVGWLIPVLFVLWGVSKLSRSELQWRDLLRQTYSPED